MQKKKKILNKKCMKLQNNKNANNYLCCPGSGHELLSALGVSLTGILQCHFKIFTMFSPGCSPSIFVNKSKVSMFVGYFAFCSEDSPRKCT